ncbi:type II toxin-antitoxin system PemK/MazF family toxin, partial [Carnobacterium divergens]
MTDNLPNEEVALEPIKIIETAITAYEDDSIIKTDTAKFKLDSTKRFVENSSKPHVLSDGKKYSPLLKKWEIICVNFSGIGSELDNTHYAIILNCNILSDAITILPLTSFKPKVTVEDHTRFSIGKLKNQGRKSVVLFNQITTISRKRIISNLKSNNKNISLTDYQIRLVLSGLRVNVMKEKHLFEELISNNSYIPEFEDPDKQYFHLRSAYKKNIEESTPIKLVYSIPDINNSEKFTVNLNKYENFTRADRKNLLTKW